MTRKQSEPLRERASGLKYISARQFVFFFLARKMHYNAWQSDKNYMWRPKYEEVSWCP